MKTIKLIILSILLSVDAFGNESTLSSFTLSAPRNKKIELKQYSGKPLLIINIATRCGYTGQLDDIEKLYKKYQKQGLTIIGIPSNDFGGQTPESNQEVVEMCRVKYGASFPISTKAIVLGKEKIPLIDYIVKSSGGEEIKWNFEKFLFDKDGKFVARFNSKVLPLESKLEEAIKKNL